MYTVDELTVRASPKTCFEVAADVERWPDILPHYRWVRFHWKEAFGTGRVEMAAKREFGPLPYPVWWVSDMEVDPTRPVVRYSHVDGITRGMRVVWSFHPVENDQTRIKIVHEWDTGPSWPLPGSIRRLIANAVIGPIFIHHVASRTLAGVGAKAESLGGKPQRPG